MSFIAKLFLDNTERLIQNASVLFNQSVDMLQRPCAYPHGGLICLKIESTREDIFWEWVVSPTMMKEGYIRFYKPDGLSKFVDLEFWDCYCVDYYEYFSHNTPEVMFTKLILSPGVLRCRGVLFTKHWRVSHPETAAIEPTYIENESYDKFYIVDSNNNKIEEINKEQSIELVIKTKRKTGKEITIDLSNDEFDFKYNGEFLKDDILRNYQINKDTERILLEVVKTLK